MHPKKCFGWAGIGVLLLLMFDQLPAQQYGWKVIAKPTSRNLYAVEFTDALHGVCAGVDTIYRTTDGGATWQKVRGPSNATFTDISFSDQMNGWIVGNFAGAAGLIWRTTNGGVSWIQQVAPDTRFVLRHWGTAAQNLTSNTTVGIRSAIADTGILRMTTNGGVSWKRRTLADSIAAINKITFVDPLHGWITAGLRNGAPALLRTHDGGKTWEIVRLKQGLPVIAFVDTVRGWGIYEGFLYRTNDGGTNWQYLTRIEDPMWDYLHATTLSFVDSLNGWAFGNMFYRGISTEVIYHTTDGGHHWLQESVGLTPDFGGVEDAKMLDRFHGWAVCGRGYVLSYQLLTEVAEKPPQKPKTFSLHQNYPNPFNASTEIIYEVQHRMVVKITVYNALGRVVRQLVNSTHEPGVYRLRFEGSTLVSGEYYYIMKAGMFTATKSMTLLK